jgi:hypothetical protein
VNSPARRTIRAVYFFVLYDAKPGSASIVKIRKVKCESAG